MKPEFLVSTFTAAQFYQPLPPKWLSRKTSVPRNFEKPARESLKTLENLAEIRSKLTGFDTTQIDLLLDHKINLNAQLMPRNAFDVPEECQFERLSRLTEVRKKLEGTEYGLANLDAVLKLSIENLMMATGVSRAHSVRTCMFLSPHTADTVQVPDGSSPYTVPSDRVVHHLQRQS